MNSNMVAQGVNLSRLERAIQEVCMCLKDKCEQRLEWTTLSEDLLWRELVACILGSRVRYGVAYSAIERMEKANLLSTSHAITRRDEYEQEVLNILMEQGSSENACVVKSRYPFPRLRAGQVSAAAETLYSCGGTIKSRLEMAKDEREARRQLAKTVSGLGPKQASLFLRNIGYTAQVAVLDVHVLTYMAWVGLTAAPVKTVRTIRQYEVLEDTFIKHSCSSGFPPDRFDLAVWVVVRVIKRDYVSCQ